MAFLLDAANNEPKEVKPKNGKWFTFEELYPVLDCSMIQVLRMDDGSWLVFDEEGKIGKVPPREVNIRASRLAHLHTGIAPDDFIVGTVLVCASGELR